MSPRGIIALLVAAALSFGATRPAGAFWTRNDDVTVGTAHTLREGDFLIGIFTPLQVGITDAITLSLHPILELLLTPNATLRLNVLDTPVAVTVTLSYFQTFLASRADDEGGGFPGTAEAGVLVSWSATDSLILTGYAGYLMDFATIQSQEVRVSAPSGTGGVEFAERRTRSTLDTRMDDHGTAYGVGLDWRIDDENLLAFQYKGVVSSLQGRHETPTASLLYAHAWERTRFGVGVAAGRFPIRTGKGEILTLPVYPIVDLWFRF
jgi:hypothetical protein